MTSGVFLTILAIVVASESRQTQQVPEGSVGSGSQRVSFFGTQAEGDNLVYVLDVSGSMGEEGGRRLKRAMSELLRSIEQLTEDQSAARFAL
jgi:Mg-chelatase subunit ChlD